MDTITHLLLGHTMGAAATAAGAPAAAYWGALVGNSLPDIDVPAGYAVRRGWAFHRKYTHTLPGVLLLSALATGILSRLFPDDPPLVIFAWTLAGCLFHVTLDCLNHWGARALWPFSNRVIGFPFLFIFDPYLVGIHGLATVAALLGAPVATPLAWAATGAYFIIRLLLRQLIRRRLPDGAVHTLIPAMGGLARWRYVSDSPEAVEWGTVTALPFRRVPSERLEKPHHPAVDASRSLSAVRQFLSRARLPYATVEQTDPGYTVTWTDLGSRLGGRSYQLRIRLDPDLTEIT
jgi:inner membrane protein